MSATAGLRYIIMNISTIPMRITMPTMLLLWKKTGMKGKAIADTKVPVRM